MVQMKAEMKVDWRAGYLEQMKAVRLDWMTDEKRQTVSPTARCQLEPSDVKHVPYD